MSDVDDIISIAKLLSKLGGLGSCLTFFSGRKKSELSDVVTDNFKHYADTIKDEINKQRFIPLLDRCNDTLNEVYRLLIIQEPLITQKNTKGNYNRIIALLNELDIDQSTAYSSEVSDAGSVAGSESSGYLEMTDVPRDERVYSFVSALRVFKELDRNVKVSLPRGENESESGYVSVSSDPEDADEVPPVALRGSSPN